MKLDEKLGAVNSVFMIIGTALYVFTVLAIVGSTLRAAVEAFLGK